MYNSNIQYSIFVFTFFSCLAYVCNWNMGTLILNQTYPLGNKGKQRSLILTNNVVNNSIVFDLKKIQW